MFQNYRRGYLEIRPMLMTETPLNPKKNRYPVHHSMSVQVTHCHYSLSVETEEIGGKDLTEYLHKLFNDSQIWMEIANDIKD